MGRETDMTGAGGCTRRSARPVIYATRGYCPARYRARYFPCVFNPIHVCTDIEESK